MPFQDTPPLDPGIHRERVNFEGRHAFKGVGFDGTLDIRIEVSDRFLKYLPEGCWDRIQAGLDAMAEAEGYKLTLLA